MLVGYARVSTLDQDTALQLDALHAAGVREIYQDRGSGVGPRPQLRAAIQRLDPGDTLVVWKLDRIARSLADLLGVIDRLDQAKATIRSLTEPIDTSSPIGEFTLQVLGAVAQLERSMIGERTRAGIRAAMARGVQWGRPRRLDLSDVREIQSLVYSGVPPSDVACAYGISRGLVYSYMSHPRYK